MPFYEYECSNCKFYTEMLQKVSDPPLKKCPSCGKNTMKKLVSAPVFRLKGSGWYETDFKSESEPRRNVLAEEKPPEKEKGAPAEAKSEGKAEVAEGSAAKTEAKPAAEGDKKAAAKAAEPPPASTRRRSRPLRSSAPRAAVKARARGKKARGRR